MAAETHPTRAAMAQFQLEQLRALLRAILPVNPLQTRKLRDAGITSEIATLEEFSRRCPFTLKSELAADQLAAPPFGTNLTFPLAHYTRYSQTSGTSGAPLRWGRTANNDSDTCASSASSWSSSRRPTASTTTA